MTYYCYRTSVFSMHIILFFVFTPHIYLITYLQQLVTGAISFSFSSAAAHTTALLSLRWEIFLSRTAKMEQDNSSSVQLSSSFSGVLCLSAMPKTSIVFNPFTANPVNGLHFAVLV